MDPKLDIIIVNWNAGAQLRRCLESIVPTGRAGCALTRVVVVDNASADGSAEHLDDLPLPLAVIRNATNVGFGAACNQGAAGSKADYLLFLNPDMRLVEASLRRPLAFLEDPARERVGIVGIRLVDEAGHLNPSCFRFPTPAIYWYDLLGLNYLFPHTFPRTRMVRWDHSATRPVDYVQGAFFVIRRPLFELLDGFDERFFVYAEDTDLAYRARQAGWECWFLAEASAYHRGAGTTEAIRAERTFYDLRSRVQFAAKHFSRPAAAGVALGTFLVEPILRLLYAAVRLNGEEAGRTLRAYGLLWGDALTRGRRRAAPPRPGPQARTELDGSPP